MGSACSASRCTAPVPFGDATVFSPCVNGVFGTGGFVGERLFIDSNIQVTALGVIASPAEPTTGVHGIMALYDDVSGLPSSLLAATASTTIAPGGNVIPVESAASIDAGYYWIMAEYDANASICEDQSMGNATVYVEAGYGGVPAVVTNPMASSEADFNYYVLGTLSTQ